MSALAQRAAPLPSRLEETERERRLADAKVDVARRAQLAEEELVPLLRERGDAWREWGQALGEAEVGGRREGHVTGDNVENSERQARHRARKIAAVPEPEYLKWREAAQPDTLTFVRLFKSVPSNSTGGDPGPLPAGSYRTLVADPPWQYDNKATRGAAEDHYSTMTIAELCDLDIDDRTGDDAHLYLWTTNGFLREAFEVVEAWGFAYKTCITWVKPQMGMGNYFRSSTEHVLFGVKGRLRTQERDMMNWFEAPRGRHSSKPGSFYDLVERASPGPYLELFARERRFGWDGWGNEA